jgi:outer membrane protein TolC
VKTRSFYAPLLACLCAVAFAQHAPSAALAASGTANTAAPLRLNDVLQLALDRSPEVKGGSAAIRAMQHRVPQASALPDPTVAAGWAGKLAPFRTMAGDASSYRGFTVTEQFPYPGKRKLQAAVASKDVDTARADCEAAQRRAVLEAKIAFAEYFYMSKAIEATRQNKELLEKLAAIAEAQYRVGKAMQQDVLRAQVEISMLTEKLTMLELQRDASIADLNAALQQAPETPLPPPEDLDAPPLQLSLSELYAQAEANDTGIARSQAAIARGKLSVELAERQYRPDIGVGYMFQQRTDQPAMNGLTVSVNVPVFWKSKQREAVQEAAETLHESERMQQGQKNSVRAEVRRQYLAAQAAQRLLTLYSRGIVPQSSLALESAMNEYQVGKVDFLSLLSSFTALLNYETETYHQIADYNTAIARIESLTGSAITAAAPDASQALHTTNGDHQP